MNSISEPLKFHHDDGTQDNPNGVLVYNNTVVKAGVPLHLDAEARATDFEIENDLFVGGDGVLDTVAWHAPFDNPTFDYNGYHPDARFTFNTDRYHNLEEVRNGRRYELHGVAVGADAFVTLRPWPSSKQLAERDADASLAQASAARNRALALPNINDAPDGHPDLGALEYGCPAPHYGARNDGSDVNDPGAADPCNGSGPPPTSAVSWTSLRNARADGGTLTKSGGQANAQDAGAISTQRLDGSATNATQFRWPRTNASGCVGLDASDPGTSCAEIRYRLLVQPLPGGPLLVSAWDGTQWLNEVTAGPGDLLQIAIIDGRVRFGKNGTRFAKAVSPVSGSMQVDTSLWDLDSTVSAAEVTRIASLPGG